MTRRAPPDGDRDSEPELIDARFRVGPLNVHRMIRSVFNVSAVLFWGVSALGAWKLAPGAVGAAVSLTQAITRASVALERSTESTARVEAAAARIESKVDRLADSCARCDGRSR